MKQRTFDWTLILLSVLIAVFGAIIGMQIITTLGVTPNTSIIGAMIAMLIARIPMQMFQRYRQLETQNLVQTTISAATFGAANSLLIPIGIPFVMGLPELVFPMLVGAGFALIIDALILYKVFDSKLFGANEAWPSGVATAEALRAGDEGGKKAKFLGIGIAGGLAGSALGIPMSALGVAFIGNIWALSMFGIGLLINGYSQPWFHFNINDYYIPHGMMIGAGLVALLQFIYTIVKGQTSKKRTITKKSEPATNHVYTRSELDVAKGFGFGFLAYVIGAMLVAFMAGLYTELPVGQLVLFILFAAFATLVSEMIVGVAAMHSGWFPAFAVTLIVLLIGIMLGFPPIALALLTGYTAATGPAFADFGFDLKTGFLIRGRTNWEQELYGRRLQLIAGMIGLVVAIVMVLLFHQMYFAQDLVPPVDRVFAATIQEGIAGETGKYLLIWAIPGAIIQLIGGAKRQLGIMLATGLLVMNPWAGWAVLVGILARVVILKWKGEAGESAMFTTAAGFIAGDALYSFFSSVFKAR
ncbi:membrane protein [Shouchella clausii]|uniref:OPT family oligopeptide transporter n=1 Tax=Shouchella clausii TaxID=79880 RepID=UPI00079A2381|nr:OPT family oligopeptide transporter [Shouchella clausii]KKI86798.1 membrane protein [Shouchella clausii]MCM3314475.1 OPT/YSL family transporter [Psychrobacillus sp. MER TA 17]GIN08988.1 membrane protein [Shouchella clausii]GIN15462.1 membrane protein [Shouchella clausii]